MVLEVRLKSCSACKGQLLGQLAGEQPRANWSKAAFPSAAVLPLPAQMKTTQSNLAGQSLSKLSESSRLGSVVFSSLFPLARARMSGSILLSMNSCPKHSSLPAVPQ